MSIISNLHKIVRTMAIISLTGLFSLVTSSFSQQKADNATNKMEQINKVMQGGCESTFKISSYNKKGTLILFENGHAAMQGGKFAVSINNGSKTISDGASQWIYNSQNNEIIIGEAASEENPADNPFIIFTNPKIHYNIAYGERVGENREIILTPKKDRRYSRIVLTLNGNSPHKIKIELSNGNRYNIEITSFKKRTNFSEKMFVLYPKEYKGVIVTDLR